MTWAHAHVVLQSHGCTGWRSCRFSCAASPSWLPPPPLPTPLLPSTACPCDGCLDTWRGGSRLGCRDCQPWECYSVQGLAGRLPVVNIYLLSYLLSSSSSSSSSLSSSLTNNYSRLDQKLLVRIPQTNSNIFSDVMLMTGILYQEQLVLGHFKFLC